MATKTIKYKVMFAHEGGLQIHEDGRRIIMPTDDSVYRTLGVDVASAMDELEIIDSEVTITIEYKESSASATANEFT